MKSSIKLLLAFGLVFGLVGCGNKPVDAQIGESQTLDDDIQSTKAMN